MRKIHNTLMMFSSYYYLLIFIIVMQIGVLDASQVNELVEKKTVLRHFNNIRSKVKLSNVMPYGDFRVGQNKLSAFIGKISEVFPKHFNNQNQFSTKNNVSAHTVVLT